jgi:O-antigen ligase
VRRNFLPLSAFAVVALVALTLSVLPGAYWEEGGKWIFLLPYAFLTTLLTVIAGSNQRLLALRSPAAATALALLLWSIASDLSTPGTFTPPTERAAGFSGNANYTALVTTMLCASALDYERRRPLIVDLFFIAVSLAIVLISLSRSGLLVLVAMLCVYAVVRIRQRPLAPSELRSGVISLAATMLVLAAASPLYAPQVEALQSQSRFRRALAGKQVDDGSAASRIAAAQDALDRIDRSPLLGHGTGYARRMPELPHNLYLQQWVNNGVLGLLGYVVFLGTSAAVFVRRRCFSGSMLIFVTALGSFFSHNVLDQRPFLFLYGLALAQSVASCPEPRNRKVLR